MWTSSMLSLSSRRWSPTRQRSTTSAASIPTPAPTRPPARIQFAYGTLEALLPKLAQRNEEGFGIFTTANAIREDYTDGFPRRKAEQVERVRVVFG